MSITQPLGKRKIGAYIDVSQPVAGREVGSFSYLLAPYIHFAILFAVRLLPLRLLFLAVGVQLEIKAADVREVYSLPLRGNASAPQQGLLRKSGSLFESTPEGTISSGALGER